MFQRLTASLAAAAVALATGLAAPAPARAESDDLVKLLLGAAAVGLIVNQISRNPPAARAATHPPHFAPPPPAPGHGWRDDRAGRDHHGRDRVVPASCLFELPGRYGPRPVVGARCVSRWDRQADLPEACVFDIRPGQGERRVSGLGVGGGRPPRPGLPDRAGLTGSGSGPRRPCRVP